MAEALVAEYQKHAEADGDRRDADLPDQRREGRQHALRGVRGRSSTRRSAPDPRAAKSLRSVACSWCSPPMGHTNTTHTHKQMIESFHKSQFDDSSGTTAIHTYS